MNVQDLIEALQKQDPSAPANDALTQIHEERERAAREFALTPPGMRSLYAQLLDHAKVHTDYLGDGNEPEDCPEHAFHGVRSIVHAALQETNPPPDPHPDDEGDPEMHHMRQKAHFKKLWQRTDALVASAGLTAKGLVS